MPVTVTLALRLGESRAMPLPSFPRAAVKTRAAKRSITGICAAQRRRSWWLQKPLQGVETETGQMDWQRPGLDSITHGTGRTEQAPCDFQQEQLRVYGPMCICLDMIRRTHLSMFSPNTGHVLNAMS